MNRKFVFESFEAYLEFSERENLPILEKETPKITEDEVKTLVQEILKKQKELLGSSGTFKEYLGAKDPYKLWLEDWRNKPENKGKSYPPEGDGLNRFSAFAAVYLWDKLTEKQKQEIYTGIRIGLEGRGYTFNEIKKINQNRKTLLTRPYIVITPTDIVKEIIITGDDVDYPLFPQEDESKLFKDNEWDLNNESFEEGQKEKIVSAIRDVLSQYSTGSLQIESVSIVSSSSRYRNTGKAESLSWGELSYNRAVTIAKIFGLVADEYNLGEEKKEELRKLISIDSNGSNGDGTSGPNPIDGRYGYYDKNSKFIDDNKGTSNGKSFDSSRSTAVLSDLDDVGKPTGVLTSATIELDSNKNDYDKYKYVNVIVKGKASEKQSIKPEYFKTKETEYSPGYLLPTKEGITPPSPRILPPIRRSKAIKPGKARKCPLL
jgi:hypothetical protein